MMHQKKISIVIVENDEDERLFMEEGFVATGKFDVLALVKNGDRLFLWLNDPQNKRPHVILSDLNMPGKNGYDIIAYTRELQPPIPVVITSTSTTRSIINKCVEAGAAGYLVKPDTFIEYENFAEKLHSLLTQKAIV